jgi:hypothetical protein
MLGEGQLIRELKVGRINHDKIRKWVKTFLPQRKADITLSPPIPKEAYFKIT